MRRALPIILAVLVVVLLGVTVMLVRQVRMSTDRVATLQRSEQDAQTRYSEAINSIAEIQDSLTTIDVGGQGARLTPSGLRDEQRLSPQQGREAMDRIALLKSSVDRAKQRIGTLEANLEKSGIRAGTLQKLVNGLKQSVADKEQRIAELTTRMDSLQTQVTGLSGEVAHNQDTIRSQRQELGMVYYVIGTKRELTQSGILVARGGVLGMGKTLKPSGTFNESLFTPIDTNDQQVVFIPSVKKVQVLSAQPVSSYALLPSGDGVELRILDPREFRMVKHLVIMTTT